AGHVCRAADLGAGVSDPAGTRPAPRPRDGGTSYYAGGAVALALGYFVRMNLASAVRLRAASRLKQAIPETYDRRGHAGTRFAIFRATFSWHGARGRLWKPTARREPCGGCWCVRQSDSHC